MAAEGLGVQEVAGLAACETRYFGTSSTFRTGRLGSKTKSATRCCLQGTWGPVVWVEAKLSAGHLGPAEHDQQRAKVSKELRTSRKERNISTQETLSL